MTTEHGVTRRDPPDHPMLGRAPLIGRLAEREAIVDVVRRAIIDNKPYAITVIGNPGVGKTRLVTEVIADLAEAVPELRAYRGAAREESGVQACLARVLRARFGVAEGTDALAQANEVCAQVMDLFGDRRVDEILHFLGAFMGVKFGRTVLADAFEEDARAFQHVARAVLRRFFEVDAQRSPLLLVFEDVHLAGEEGARLLRDLAASLGNVPVVVLFTARAELLAICHDFTATPRDHHLRIDLGPLDTGESQVLARALLARIENVPQELVDAAVEMGGGNPLLIEQLVRIFFDQEVIRVDPDGLATIDLDRLDEISLPMSVEDAVRTRLAALTPPERELLEHAALIGSVFWLGGLVVLGRIRRDVPQMWGGGEDLAPHVRDLLKGLEEKDYVLRMPDSSIAGDEEYIFKHNLERERLLSLVPQEESVRYHLLLAEWLEFRIAERGEEQLDLLARHYELGNRPLRAARCYLESADRARARYANQKAVDHYRRGLDLLGEHDVGLRLDASHHLGDVLTLLGRSDEALAQFRAMLALAYRLDLKAKGGASHNRIGRLYRDSGNLEEAMRHLGTGLALFESAGDERGIASSLDDIGKVHWMRGAYETALRFLEDGLRRREALGDGRSIALSLNNIGLVYQDSGQYAAAYDALTRALDLRRGVNDMAGMVITLNNLGTVHQDKGQDAEAIRLWMQALEIAREIGDKRRQAVLLLNIGEGQYRLRNPDEAVRLLTEVEQLCVELGDRLLLAEARRGLGKAHYLRGNIGMALSYLERALELFEQVRSKVHVGIARRSLAEVLAAHGYGTPEGKRADALFRDALKVFESLGAEIELARTSRTYGDFLAQAAESGVDAVADEAERLKAKAEALFARLHGPGGAQGYVTYVETTNPGLRRDSYAPGGPIPAEPSIIVSDEERPPDEMLTPPEGVRV